MAYVFAAVVEYAVANFIKKPEIDRLARRVFPISFSLLRKVFILPWFMNNRVSSEIQPSKMKLWDIKTFKGTFYTESAWHQSGI